MEKPKSLMDKDLTWSERSYLIDVFIAEEWTKRIDAAMIAFGKKRGCLVGADYSPKGAKNEG